MNERTPGRAQLLWSCRRGMKELDVLLERYLRTHFDAASREQQAAFAELLELQDPELYALLLGRKTETNPVTHDVIKAIRGATDP
jgi:antitoxin CptB